MPVHPTKAAASAPASTPAPTPAADVDETRELRTALVETRAELQRMERAAADGAANSAIASALAGQALASPHAAQQLASLLRSEISVASGGVATGPAGEPIGDFVRRKLSAPEYAHFLRGVTSSPALAAPATGSPAAPLPDSWSAGEAARMSGTVNLSEAIIRFAGDQRAAASAAGQPATNTRLPFGLRPQPK